MNPILLNDPIPVTRDRERLRYFAGRHLGEEEFDRRQAYADSRLLPLLRGRIPGIIRGLDVQAGASASGSEGFIVNPGLAIDAGGEAVGLYYPIRQTWESLYQAYLDETGAASAAGVFYLTLRRQPFSIDVDQDIDPCQRTELDPTRDTQRVLLGTLALHRISISPAAVGTASRELIENWAVADQLDGKVFDDLGHAVPIGLLAMEADGSGFALRWFSQEAGRYLSQPLAGYRALYDQVSVAMRRVMTAAAGSVSDTVTLQEFLANNLRLDFLPAAGQLPLQMLDNPSSTTPSLLWMPGHLRVDIVPVPEDAVAELIGRHLARRVIDLREAAGDRIRLLLAVDESDYRRDLLDIPQIDGKLTSDLFRYFVRAHDHWRQWRQQFDALYHHGEEDVLSPEQIDAVDLPEPVDAPQTPPEVVADVISIAETELRASDTAPTPYPYSDGLPPLPDFYANWLVGDDTDPTVPPAPPAVTPPEGDGLVVRYAVTLAEIEKLDNQVRSIRSRLEKTRDYLLLQRQQLDSQTVSLAALAGGVAGDGSGLQVARWLPYTRLSKGTTEAAPAGGGERAAPPASEPPASAPPQAFPTLPVTMSAPFMMTLATSGSSGSAQSKKSTPVFSSALTLLATQNLKFNPLQSSAIELGINKARLDKLAEAPKQALTLPAFATKQSRFGVLEHIAPENQEYKMAYRGMAELLTTLDGLFDPPDASKVKARLKGFGTPISPTKLSELDKTTGDADLDRQNATQARYEALFRAGKILTKQITYFETRYNTIEAGLQNRLRQRVRRENDLEKLAALIEQGRKKLDALDKRRIERLGDYGVAQRLLDENWRRVFDAAEDRTRILTTAVRGLFYVRERQTPISRSLPDPLELRHGSTEDIVPGCDADDEPLIPDDLEEFLDAVMEVPVSDWRGLRAFRSKLPGRRKISLIYQLKKERAKQRKVQYSTPRFTRAVQQSLHVIRLQNQSVFQQFAASKLSSSSVSIRKFNDSAADVLALQDALSGSAGRLRRAAQQLSDRIEQCVSCLLERLVTLPPSIRLQWAQLAEDDRLVVDDVRKWPGLERAERDDFNTARTVAELVSWWFSQLHSRASGPGQTAMRNMIRAVLIHASLGDPAEILEGKVEVPPRRFDVGEGLRLKLNRPAAIGTALQLLDNRQRIVGLLSVRDHDKKGTLADIVRVERRSIKVDTRFTVVASRRTKMLEY